MPSVDLRPAGRPVAAPPLARTVKPGRTLCRLAEAGATGVLTVQGQPDGAIRLRDGLVVGVRVRGRPAPVRPAAAGPLGAEAAALLDTADRLFVLCSGRVRECRFTPADSPDALTGSPTPDPAPAANGSAVANSAAAANGSSAADGSSTANGTTANGTTAAGGAAGLNGATAASGAAGLNGPTGSSAGREPDELPGLAVDRLLAEVDRRIAALSAVEPVIDPLTDLIRHAPGRLPDHAAARLLSTREQTLLTAVDGASTCASLAAALGRSTFGTALDVSRLVRVGRLQVLPPEGAPGLALNRRRPGSGPIKPRNPAPATFDPSDPDVADRLLAALDSLRPSRRRPTPEPTPHPDRSLPEDQTPPEVQALPEDQDPPEDRDPAEDQGSPAAEAPGAKKAPPAEKAAPSDKPD